MKRSAVYEVLTAASTTNKEKKEFIHLGDNSNVTKNSCPSAKLLTRF
ncbi:MAG: hypothetical protein HXN41_08065 [Prevotella histicola]|nr:hypothetical protein [Prevotella histicola]MBF1425692.1 hypothetical protein [Prevotella histicola]